MTKFVLGNDKSVGASVVELVYSINQVYGGLADVRPAKRLAVCKFGRASDAHSRLRSSFPRFWSENIRRPPLSDLATTRWSMQPNARTLPNAEAAKGPLRSHEIFRPR